MDIIKVKKDPVQEAVTTKRKYKKRKIVLVRKRFCPECDKIVNAVYKNNKCRECGTITQNPDKPRNGRKKYKLSWYTRQKMSKAQKEFWAKKKNGHTETVGQSSMLTINGKMYISADSVARMLKNAVQTTLKQLGV